MMQRALNDKCSTRGLSRDRLFKADSDGAHRHAESALF